MRGTTTRLDAQTLRDHARGRWRDILAQLHIDVPTKAHQHAPCPVCGGKDRFRFDDQDGRGTWFCNQCDPKAGDGFDLVQNVRRCDFHDALQLIADTLGYQPTNGQVEPQITETYDYLNEDGALLFQVVRFTPKDFRQRRPDGRGGWIWKVTGIEPVLYKLPDVLAASSVLIVEGEKDVETAYRLGLPAGWAATCNPMGAGKWRDSYSDALAGKYAVILPDADEPGEKHGAQVAHSLAGKAASVRCLTLPNGSKDLTEWAEGKTTEEFHALLEQAAPFPFMSPSQNGTLHEREFTPLPAGDFLDLGQEDEAVEWVLDEYLPAGGLVLLAAKPKEGKTTLTYELAVKVATRLPFMNRQTNGGGVLILALEEYRRDVRLRLRALGAEAIPHLFIFAGSLNPTPDVFEAIKRFVIEHTIRLILLDTLGVFWNVRDENDAAEVTKAMKPILALARETGACVLLVHHARKSDGAHGDEIRGSGALFAAVDVALILKRHEVQTQRVLHAVSRYPETPSELVLELSEAGYVALGDPANLNRQAKRDRIKAALRPEPDDIQTIRKRANLSLRDTYRLLADLVEQKDAVREGRGRKGSPFQYRANSIHATPPVLGMPLHETNPNQTEFLSCDPPSPCMNENVVVQPEEVVNLAD